MVENKTRIGILTYHRSINYGAFLQCYALSKKLINQFPETRVEVLDYCPKFEIDKYSANIIKYVFGGKANKSSISTSIRNLGKLILMPTLLRDKKIMNKAFEQVYSDLPLSKKKWITDDYEIFWNDISRKYDVIIVGSDAIWETKVFPFPNAYFLDDSVDTIRMSYAACTGRMSANDYDRTTAEKLKHIWRSYSYLGVRDDATARLISMIDESLVTHHNCDPSIILDMDSDPKFDKEIVKNKLIEKKIDLDKPIIGIMGGQNMGKMLRDFWKDKYQIVAVYYPNKYADCFLPSLTPFEWAIVFSYFKLTFTRYFHGTIFSLKNGTPTISIDDWKPKYVGQLSKLEDIMDRLGLKEHYFKIDQTMSEEGRKKIKETAETFITSPDTEKITAGIFKEKNAFIDFENALRRILQKEK